ncbi:hypothetical protein MTR67_036577 [Solanum verrucosum]|uniref:Uncharacterized protein n=1 Tax=Solanum verrucosum TaxID=315347 RepID=A0AAF0UC16_SOLVR|nr:hypothetical protein MTR67_036577 [Solanum verrucosum]
MEVVILDRFSGTGNPEGWLYRAERYFTFLGFAEEYWLPLPSFYLEGEALTWFNWLFRNKQFFDWMHFKEKFIQHFSHQTKVYPVVRTTVPRNFQTSFAFRSAYETQTSKEDHVFDKLSDTVDSLVHEPSVVTKVPEFAEISYTTPFPTIHDPNASFHDEEPSALVGLKVSDTSIRSDSLQPEVTIQVLDESSHGIKLKEVRSIAPRVSLLVPFDGPEVVRPNEHLERDMSMRYADVNSLASGSPKLKTDSETFVNWYLSDLFMESVGNENLYLKISTSSIHFVKILPDTENGKSTRAFNDQNISSQFPLVPAANLFIIIMPVIAMDLCVWDPGICFEFMALTDFIENAEELLLLGCPCKFFLNIDSNSMSRVWDPGQTWCVHCYFSNGSCVMYNYIAFTCPSIAYELVVEEYYYVNYDVLADNFKQTSVLRPDVSTSFDGKTESCYLVLVRKNHIALLSSTIGLQNYDAHFNVLPIGIIGPMKVFGRHSVAHEVLSISAHHWSLKICLHGLFHNWFAGRTHWFVFVVINGDVVGSSTKLSI